MSAPEVYLDFLSVGQGSYNKVQVFFTKPSRLGDPGSLIQLLRPDFTSTVLPTNSDYIYISILLVMYIYCLLGTTLS